MRHFDPFDFLWIAKDLLYLLIPAAAGAWAWVKVRHAYSWPSAQGTIMSAQVKSGGDSYFQPWAADLVYSYIVNGEYYSGFHRIRARSERKADERVMGWKGRMVVVRYSPSKHDLSVLLKSDQPGGQLGN